jgi:hypothetical protein
MQHNPTGMERTGPPYPAEGCEPSFNQGPPDFSTNVGEHGGEEEMCGPVESVCRRSAVVNPTQQARTSACPGSKQPAPAPLHLPASARSLFSTSYLLEITCRFVDAGQEEYNGQAEGKPDAQHHGELGSSTAVLESAQAHVSDGCTCMHRGGTYVHVQKFAQAKNTQKHAHI